MYSHLNSLAIDLRNQINESQSILDYRHFVLLKNLSPIEKKIIAKTVLEWSWNVGSTHLLKYLQKSNVLSMSDMILYASTQDIECAQLILTDLFEMEFILLGDLMGNFNCTDSTSLTICDILNEGCRRMCRDIIENVTILTKNYLDEVQPFLQDEDIEQMCSMHFTMMLEESPQHSQTDAIENQQLWNNEFNNVPDAFNSFLEFIVGNNFKQRQKTLLTLFKKCIEPKCRNWKFLLLFLRKTICDTAKFSADEQNDLKTNVKKFLKDTFRGTLNADCNDVQFYALFLVVRQITEFNKTILGNYGTWFKDNIGEMKYLLNIDEFTIVMGRLMKLNQFESDEDILNIHINTYMPAPLHCNELVLNFKQLCRCRLLHLKNKIQPNDDADIFVVDDSN